MAETKAGITPAITVAIVDKRIMGKKSTTSKLRWCCRGEGKRYQLTRVRTVRNEWLAESSSGPLLLVQSNEGFEDDGRSWTGEKR